MAVGAEFDRDAESSRWSPAPKLALELLLGDDCTSVRLVVQDPATDAVSRIVRRDPREARDMT